ncbi:SDR family oxidoreductase [Pseudomonas sp. CDFA 602]|uniref:SDR family NAD(P)-dependent oxidoreductase n=1 Tax=Pseudomonas californiensis TaxID=2829823 RepID=UPI001E659EC6|nr:SDR family oxidoreductase [Pseudomonas californiensis]MCD5996854.1 SDR family oxidoreductase [Pseudomonas californiensis]MCD5998329.1 SDR family oxidoreductase [Pseudomonas californiensis]
MTASPDTPFNPFSLAGKRILVTGASSGIGREVALTCAKMGALVLATGRDEQRLAETLSSLQAISDLAHQAVSADLTIEVDRTRLISAAEERFDGLVHCAGISRLSPVRMMTQEHLRGIHAINVEAPMLITQGLLIRNKIARNGSILFISSIAAKIGIAGVGAYSGSKAALIALSRCLSTEVAKHGIRSNCLAPSFVDTPMLTFDVMNLKPIEEHHASHPLGFGKPEDIANAAVFFLSDASRWITGSTLIMDGGLTVT